MSDDLKFAMNAVREWLWLVFVNALERENTELVDEILKRLARDVVAEGDR